MARRIQVTRGGVPSGKLPVRPVAPRKSLGIAAGEVGSASGAVTPHKVPTGHRPPRGLAG